jgi:hypothetical protein
MPIMPSVDDRAKDLFFQFMHHPNGLDKDRRGFFSKRSFITISMTLRHHKEEQEKGDTSL